MPPWLLLLVAAFLWTCRQEPAAPSPGTPQGTPTVVTGEPVLAFPGAMGFGAFASGGRGGRVIKVTSLAASGPGTLRAAVEAKGARIVVFEVSGVIDAPLIEIPHGNLTIAGQTAPGAGITLRGRLYAAYRSGVDNVIIRHLRVRPPAFRGGEGAQFDAIQFSQSRNIILDHVSVAFAVDEAMDFYQADQVTVQWCTIEETATKGHPEGAHNYGLIQGEDGYEISIHHNLFAHQKSRAPAIANGPAEVINNVAYNVRQGFVHHNNAKGHFNIIGNVYRRGPSDKLFPFYFDFDEAGKNLGYYLHDNYIDDPDKYLGRVDNPWKRPHAHPAFQYLEIAEDGSSEKFRSTTPFDMTKEGEGLHQAVARDDALAAYDSVLAKAGAFPRDQVTLRTIEETRTRTGSWGAHIPSDLLLGLKAVAPPVDSDGDGMPDQWEKANGLSAKDPTDSQQIMPSGYTAIENYINQRADALLPEGER